MVLFEMLERATELEFALKELAEDTRHVMVGKGTLIAGDFRVLRK